ncbi:MAG: nitrite reductase small subunit NirD [Acidimicrobiales bacterium]
MTLVDGRPPATAVGSDRWVDVCALSALTPDRGVAALVHGRAVAVFRCSDPIAGSGADVDDELYAIDNVDPFSGASVLSRGIVGSLGERPTVASPVHKHRFDLRSGEAIDVADVRLDTWGVRVVDGRVRVSPGPHAPAPQAPAPQAPGLEAPARFPRAGD